MFPLAAVVLIPLIVCYSDVSYWVSAARCRLVPTTIHLFIPRPSSVGLSALGVVPAGPTATMLRRRLHP